MAISGGVVGLREEARWHQLAQSVRARGCGVVCVYCVCGNAETGNAPPRHGAGALATGSLKICASVFLCRPALPMLELGVLGERTPERTPLEYSGQKRRNSNKVHEQWSLSLSLSLSQWMRGRPVRVQGGGGGGGGGRRFIQEFWCSSRRTTSTRKATA